MPVRLLLISALVFTVFTNGWGQKFANRNLYDIWITAGEHLDAGRFDAAVKLYEVAPSVPEFAKRRNATRRIQALFQAGERYYRARRYPEALEAFSRYRTIDPTLHVDILDQRIQACLQELDKKLATKLDESTRVVAGFEWAYKGEQQLAVLDTTAARNSFTKAKQLGGGLNATLREQYQQGLRAVQSLGVWGEEYRRASARDGAPPLAVLRAYRSASKYIVSSVEYEIKSAEEGEKATLAATSPAALNERMRGYVEECRMEDLFYFVKNNRQLIPDADTLAQRIADYRRVEGDVRRLKKDPANRPFLESTYETLLETARRIPELGPAALQCARGSYHQYLLESARIAELRGDETADKDKYREAVSYLTTARTLELDPLLPKLDEIQSRLADKLDCESTQRAFDPNRRRGASGTLELPDRGSLETVGARDGPAGGLRAERRRVLCSVSQFAGHGQTASTVPTACSGYFRSKPSKPWAPGSAARPGSFLSK